jgi:hypothetical protein
MDSLRGSVGGDTGAYPAFSVRLEGLPNEGSLPRPLHTLYEGCVPVVRSRSARPVIDTLRYAIAAASLDEASGQLVRLRAQAITLDRDAVLLPPRLDPTQDPFHRRSRSRGFRRWGFRTVWIASSRGGVMLVPEPPSWDDSAARRLLGAIWSGGEETLPSPGHYRVRGWVVESDVHPPTRASAVAHGMRFLVDRGTVDGRDALRVLATVARRATIVVEAAEAEHSATLEAASELL